jgi:hypothetical protein
MSPRAALLEIGDNAVRKPDLGNGVSHPAPFRKSILDRTSADLDELEDACRARNKDPTVARRMVRRLQEGLDIREATAIVMHLVMGEGMSQGSNGHNSAFSVDDALKGIDARRSAIAARLDAITKEKQDLRTEERTLNQAARALRKITGAANKEFYCDECELPFASRQGLATHKTRVHAKEKVGAA